MAGDGVCSMWVVYLVMPFSTLMATCSGATLGCPCLLIELLMWGRESLIVALAQHIHHVHHLHATALRCA